MRLAKLTAALVAAGLALPAFAASSDAATLQKLLGRMENWKRATPNWKRK